MSRSTCPQHQTISQTPWEQEKIERDLCLGRQKDQEEKCHEGDEEQDNIRLGKCTIQVVERWWRHPPLLYVSTLCDKAQFFERGGTGIKLSFLRLAAEQTASASSRCPQAHVVRL